MLKNARLIIDEKNVDLTVEKPTIGAEAIVTENLYKDLGVVTFDPSAMSTAVCKSSITYIDGTNGILRYRGYDIKDIADNADFLDTCYLLLHGDKANAQESKQFRSKIEEQSYLDDYFYEILSKFERNLHPMAMLSSLVLHLSSPYVTTDFQKSPEKCDEAAIELVAKMPVLIAAIHRHIYGMEFIKSDPKLSYGENFLHMMFGDKIKNAAKIAEFLEKIFILHADHGQNASTFAVRTVGSTKVNPIACVSAGICSLWGPSHGGANEKVIAMLKEIGSKDQIEHYLQKVKDPNDSFLLMGFGHRVYKNFDPRAQVLKGISDQVLSEIGDSQQKELFEIALDLEKIALNDEYFKNRKLYPNVDFYSGIILSAMQIPPIMFTPIFALSRTIGWISHWKEMITDPSMKIFRPRQVYVGQDQREY